MHGQTHAMQKWRCINFKRVYIARNVHKITFTSLYGVQVFSLHFKRRTKDPPPIVLKCVIHIPYLTENRLYGRAD